MAERDENGRFLPGWSGGPGRPPKEKSLTSLINQFGEAVQENGKTRWQSVVEQMFAQALDGDRTTQQYLIDRWEGKPTQREVVESVQLPSVIRFDDEDDTEDSDAGTQPEAV